MDTSEVTFLGMKLTANMTVLRLGDGRLLVHSPIALTAERRVAVEKLGPVAHLYSPNLFHHLRLGDWAAAYPKATLHASPGLARKRPDLRIDRIRSSAPEPAFSGLVDELPVYGFRLEETALFHRPSRTLIVADVVHNIGKPTHGWTRLYSTAMGFYNRVAVSRAIRWTAFPDRVAARRSIDELLACPFERIVVGHGEPLVNEPHRALAAAYQWLPARREALASGLKPSGCA